MKNVTFTIALFAVCLFTTADLLAQRGKKQDPDEAAQTMAKFIETDEGIGKWFGEAYGYVVFPSIGKGAIGIGGAAGHGVVYKRGNVSGGAKMIQISIGFQWGGQAFSEVIFFEDERAYNQFVEGNFEFAAQVSAVALTSGVSADAEYRDGVAVFTQAIGGLMYQASVGGQKFTFYPPNKMK